MTGFVAGEFTYEGNVLTDKQTGSQWNRYGLAIGGPLKGQQLDKLGGGAHFAFAWLAFNPDSEIYKVE